MVTLRQTLNEVVSKTPILLRPGFDLPVINVSQKEFINAKYLCTEEEKDFTFYKGKVFFKGFQLICKRW